MRLEGGWSDWRGGGGIGEGIWGAWIGEQDGKMGEGRMGDVANIDSDMVGIEKGAKVAEFLPCNRGRRREKHSWQHMTTSVNESSAKPVFLLHSRGEKMMTHDAAAADSRSMIVDI